MKRILIFGTTAALAANVGHAGRDDADACAAGLDVESRSIYLRVLPEIVPGDKLANKKVIKATIKEMIAKGELGKANPQRKVKAATACISKLGS